MTYKPVPLNSSPSRPARKQRRDVDYFLPKKAFDQVMEHYPVDSRVSLFGTDAERKRDRRRIKSDLSLRSTYTFYNEAPKKNKKGKAQGIIAAKGIPVKNTTAPSIQDFRVDVEREVRKVIKTAKHKAIFIKRYLYGLEIFSKEIQHLFSRFEQQIGNLFIKAKIYPLGTYFVAIRRKEKVRRSRKD